jgi:uncharacterized protein (TIGR01777 family)
LFKISVKIIVLFEQRKNKLPTLFLYMPTVLITGGTGLIGKALTKELRKRNYDLIILTRFPERYTNSPGLSYAKWNVEEQLIDKDAITRADHIIHLAGENVGEKRWRKKRKKVIVESRTLTSDLLVRALKETANTVKTVVSASGIGWYGEQKSSVPFTETDAPADDFLGQTCKQWEKSIEPVTTLGKRLVKLRTGIVLSSDGGALAEFKKYLQFGIATILGNGKQVVSWIHIDDLVRMFVYAVENESLHGAYNAVAPFPVTNRTFVLELAKKTKGRFFIPVYVPTFVLKIVLGEMSIEVLKSATVSSEKIKQAGFDFLYPSVIEAIRQLSGD